jgi:hypothetical protein
MSCELIRDQSAYKQKDRYCEKQLEPGKRVIDVFIVGNFELGYEPTDGHGNIDIGSRQLKGIGRRKFLQRSTDMGMPCWQAFANS